MRFPTRLIAVAVLCAVTTGAAFAGKSTSMSGSRSTTISRSPARSVSAAPKAPSYKPSYSQTTRTLGGNSRLPNRLSGLRQSLISSSGPQPSSRVTQIIHERESSGPGWLGTAFLVSMLSRNDLSGSDRSWVQSRIDALKSEGADEAPLQLLKAVSPKVAFSFKGLDEPLYVGKSASVIVTAQSGGKAVPVSCDHPAAHAVDGHAQIVWTPDTTGVSLITCKAGDRQEQRLVRVLDKDAA